MTLIFKRILNRIHIFILSPRSAIYLLYGICYNLYNNLVRNVFHYFTVTCNVCGWQGYRFSAMIGANYIRPNALCPSCMSAERNRAFIKYLDKISGIDGEQRKCLDIAPTSSYRAYLESRGWDYISIDLYNPAMMKMDATKMEFVDNSFDMVICFHVLEHIKEDIKAMSEIRRVLKNEGTGYIMVPIDNKLPKTTEYEKPDPLDPDHVRAYGTDFKDRLIKAGLSVKEIDLLKEIDKDTIQKHVLGKEHQCFVLSKNPF